MDRNTVIGFGLIFLLMMGMTYMNRPTEEQLAESQRKKDSIAAIVNIDTTQQLAKSDTTNTIVEQVAQLGDSAKVQALSADFGGFANSASGEAKDVSIKNDVFEIIFNTKGGNIKEVKLIGYEKFVKQKDNTFLKAPLSLMDDAKNKFEYILPVANSAKGTVKTSDLYFTPTIEGKTITFRASAGNGKYFEQKYSMVSDDEYTLDYNVSFVGLDKVIPNNSKTVQLNWDNYLEKLEKNASYERSQYSGVHYRTKEEDCSCVGNKSEDFEGKEVEWISSAQQFFNSTIIAKTAFSTAKVEAKPLEETDENLKLNSAEIQIPFNQSANETFAMQMYIGPNDFDVLREFDNEMEDIVEFGWGIFGTINRWVIRPVFSFVSNYVSNAGIAILILTLLVKMVLYPLSYKMYYSQAKMGVLKPELEKIKERTGDDQQAYSAEQMKLYQQTGVNPLGGCMPMVLQMPIWFALYRFFPASIEFRQKSFLWADDLSSYDSIATFDIPALTSMGLDHISLFTILWAISTLVYTYYNTRHMTMPNPAMKYVQYLMPIMFIFFFNSFASGLTAYLLFSTILNITQTILTKEVLIDKDKIKTLLEENKKKPKKTSGFQARLQEAMKQQEEVKKKQAQEKTDKTRSKRNNRKK
jgi:YidC/Oxa1 family membrane protein insertase